MRATVRRIIRDKGSAVFTDGQIDQVINDVVIDMTIRAEALYRVTRINTASSPEYSYTYPWEVTHAGLESLKIGREEDGYVIFDGPTDFGTYTWERTGSDLEQEAVWEFPPDIVRIVQATYEDANDAKKRITAGSKKPLDERGHKWVTDTGIPIEYIVDMEDPFHFMLHSRPNNLDESPILADAEYGVATEWEDDTFLTEYGVITRFAPPIAFDSEYGIANPNHIGAAFVEFTSVVRHQELDSGGDVFDIPRPYQIGIAFGAAGVLLGIDSEIRNLNKSKILGDLATNITRRLVLATVARRVASVSRRPRRRTRPTHARLPDTYADSYL